MDTNVEVVLDSIAGAAAKNGLVPFLGAGINGTIYPRWGQLVDRLLREALRPYLRKNSPCSKWLSTHNDVNREFDLYAQATLAKTLLADNYTEVLRQQVYKPMADANKDDSTIVKVADLCCAPEIKAVVTYNYDTHLEDAYEKLEPLNRKRGQKLRGMTSVGLSARLPHPLDENDHLLVYHVHGLLARPSDLHRLQDDPVVLAYDEYSETMRDFCNWANATQIHFLRSRPCLFLGQSMSDWNVLRLLESCHTAGAEPRHWLLTSEQESVNDFHFDAKSTVLNSVGVQLVVFESFTKLYEAVGKLPHLISIARRKNDGLA